MGQCHRSYSLKQKCHPLGDEIYLVNDIAICLPRVAIHRPIVLFEAKKRRGHVWQRGRERAVRGQSPLHTKRRTKTKPLSAHPRWVHYLVASATEKGPAAEPADGFAQRSSGTPSISNIESGTTPGGSLLCPRSPRWSHRGGSRVQDGGK